MKFFKKIISTGNSFLIGDPVFYLREFGGIINLFPIGEGRIFIGRGGSAYCWALHETHPYKKIPISDLKSTNHWETCIKNYALSVKRNILCGITLDFRFAFWDLRTGSLIKTTRSKKADPELATANDDYFFLISIDGKKTFVHVWSFDEKKMIKEFIVDDKSPTCAACDSERLAVGFSSGAIEVWDISDSFNNSTLYGHEEVVKSVSIKKDILASGSRDRTVRIWDLKKKALRFTKSESKETILSVVCVQDYVMGGDTLGIVHIWRDTGTLSKSFSAFPDGEINVLESDGKHLFAASASIEGNHLKAWKLTDIFLSRGLVY